MRMKVMMILVACALLAMPLASSSIFIDPLKPVYNYGDKIEVNTKIVSPVGLSSHYVVDLKCGNNISYNIYNSFVQTQPNVEKTIVVATELLNPLLDNITASCFLKAMFGDEAVNSKTFSLSKIIDVSTDLEFDNLNPGNVLVISGKAMTKSGLPVEGFAELFIPSLNLYKSTLVVDGFFNLSLELHSGVKSGEHEYKIEVHNTDHNSRKINFGSGTGKFSINQILKQVIITLNQETVKPESDFIFKVDAIDQAGDVISREVSLMINQPKGIPYIKKIIKSGEEQKITFLLSDIPGYWSIETDVDGMKNRKLFYLAEVNTLQTSLINNTLIITNIGNAPYSGPIEITIGSFVEIKQVNLAPAQTQKFNLRAPDGSYSIAISDEEGEQKSLGSAFLTGNAVKVTDFKEDVIYTFTNPLIWWLGVALLILVVVLVQVKIRMQRMPKAPSVAPQSPTSSPQNLFKNSSVEFSPNTRSNVASDEPKKFDMSWFNKSANSVQPSTSASLTPKVNPSSLFGSAGQGIRERAAAIALYVSSNSPQLADAQNRALSIAKETGAKIYLDGEYKIILLSPRLTKVQENEGNAVNIARRMQAVFLELMSTSAERFNFGIGVSDGEIISEIENGKFHFTSTGNLISYAKRLAHASNTKLLVSDSIRRKLISTIKAEKSPYQGVWEVTRVVDHSPSRDFIKRFSERNG